MKILKRIVFSILIILVLGFVGAFIYFDQKFTPEKNYLTLDNESGNIPITWLGKEKNVLLLPIHFPNETVTYYLQFDTGAPSTILYSKAITQLKQIKSNGERAKTIFYIGKTKISSNKFQILTMGDNNTDTHKIIGTIGADILENRKTIINFKENFIVLNLAKEPKKFKGKSFDFKFKKRKIIIPGLLNGNKEKFLFDSGTSAYELLTNEEIWEKLKLPNSKIKIEKSEQSWNRILTTYTSNCNQSIQFSDKKLKLANVTYVKGISQAQYAMMKFSGMTGMLGNKIFLNNCLYIDCSENKITIE